MTTRQRHSRGGMAPTGVTEAVAQARQCHPRGLPTIGRHGHGKDLEPGLAVRLVGHTNAVGPAVVGEGQAMVQSEAQL